MMSSTRKVIFLVAMMPLATSCTKSGYNLSSNERAILTQVKESRVQNAPIAPSPKILPETHFAAGRMFEEQGQFGKAIDQYRKAIAVNHNFTAAYHRLGLLYSRLLHHELALEALKKAVALEPRNSRLRNNLGFELMFFEQWGEAEVQLRKAVELDPRFARAHINLAMALCKQDRFDEALASFRTVLPEPDAYYNLGLLYRGQRRYAEATTAFRYVLTLHPGFNAARTQLEELAEMQGDDAVGERALRMAKTTSTPASDRDAEFRMREDTGVERQHMLSSRSRAESSPNVRESQPMRGFSATNRMTDAQQASSPEETTVVSKIARVSRVRGREPQPDVTYADDEPLLTGSVALASSSEFDDPDCETDTVLTARTQAERDRFRPSKMDVSRSLPSRVDSQSGSSFDRSRTASRGERFKETQARGVSTSGPSASGFVQPTTLRDFAALQLDERGPDALAFILIHDPTSRPPQSQPESKPMLVRDRPIPPRERRPDGKPRTDSRGWPSFLDPILRDSEFLRTLQEGAPRETFASSLLEPHNFYQHVDHGQWLMDFGFLHRLTDVVANEVNCLSDQAGAWMGNADVWDGGAGILPHNDPASWMQRTWPLPMRSGGVIAYDLTCPADIILDTSIGASIVLFQQDPVCEAGTSDDDIDTISIGDARRDKSDPASESFGRMPPLRH